MGSLNTGLLIMSLIQMFFLSLTLGRCCSFASRHGAPGFLVFPLFLYFALHPVFSTLAVSMTKDTLFAAAFIHLTLDVFELCDNERLTPWRCARFILLFVLTALLRPNGVFALFLMIPGLFIVYRRKLSISVLILAAIAMTLTVLLSLQLILRPIDMPSSQLYSVPAQQLVRAYHSGKLSDETRKKIQSWYTSEEGLIVHPHLADPAKGYLDSKRLSDDSSSFLSLWLQVGKECPVEYMEAFLMLNIGQWYPDDVSHRTVYPDVSYNDKGYLQTQEYEIDGFDTHSYIPALTQLMEQICRRNAYAKVPGLTYLFSPAMPFWLLLLCMLVIHRRNQSHLIPACLGALGLSLSYLFGACTQARYVLPLFAMAPTIFLAVYWRYSHEKA